MDLAQARLQSVEVDRTRHTSYAPADAIVDSLLFEPGERPTAGMPIAILLTGEQAYARVFIPGRDSRDRRAGDHASVYVDGIDTPFPGVVRWVSSESAFTPYFALTEADRGRLTYPAKVDISGANRRIPMACPSKSNCYAAISHDWRCRTRNSGTRTDEEIWQSDGGQSP